MVSKQTEFPDRELRLGEIVFALLQAVESGQTPDRQQLLDGHPEFATDLAEFFADQDRVQELARPLEAILQASRVGDTPFYDSAATPAEADFGLPGTETEVRHFGDYEVLGKIGQGGMGIVYKATHRTLRRVVALKLILAGRSATPSDVQRFHNEAEAVANLDHPHIVPIYDHGEYKGHPYFTMKLVGGGSLAQHLAALSPSARPGMPPRDAARLLVTVARAVHYAHQHGILHRDLKPANVLLDPLGQPHVTDFGLAKRLRERGEGDSNLTLSGTIVGTPSYMAPEQAAGGKGTVTTATDVYGLGATLYAALTGRAPFQGDNVLDTLRLVRECEVDPPSRGNPAVDRDLETVCLKCLQKDPGRRYASAEAVAQDLEHYLRDEPVQARPPSVWYRCRKFTRRNRVALTIGGCFLLMMTLSAVSIGWAAQDRAAREAALDGEVQRDLREAGGLIEDSKWPEALALVERTEKLLAAAGRQERPQRLLELRNDLAMAQRLEDIYTRPKTEEFVWGQEPDAAYAEAFAADGIDVTTLSVSEAAARIRARSIWRELARALDSWSHMRQRTGNRQAPDWKRLLEIAAEADPDPVRNPIREARKSGDRKALEALAVSAEVSRLPPETLLRLASALYDSGGKRQATALLRQAQLQYPQDCWINNLLGWYCLTTDPPQHDEAIRFYTACRAGRPQNPYFLHAIGQALKGKKAFAEAVAAFSRCIELKPDYWDAWCHRGEAYLGLGAGDKAVADFTHVVDRNPQVAGWWYERGVTYLDLAQWDKALPDFTRALELNPDSAPALTNRAKAYHHLHQYDKALADYSRLIELNPRDADPWCGRGTVYLWQGRPELALAEYSRAIELQSDLTEAWHGRGIAYVKRGQTDKALADFLKATELNPDHASAWFYRTWCHRELKQWPEAIAGYSKLLQLNSKPGITQNELAWLLANCPDTHYRDNQRALDLAKIAVLLKPEQQAFWNTLGLAHYRAGDWKTAAQALEKSIELGKGGTAFDWFVLAMAQWERGQKEEARKSYDRAVQWMEKEQPQDEDLRGFRKEAAELLGVK